MSEKILNRKPTEVLKVKIDDKSYSVPLAGSLSYYDAKAFSQISDKPVMEQLDFAIRFFSKYIPQEVIESLTCDDLKEIFVAWSEASGETGQKLGES